MVRPNALRNLAAAALLLLAATTAATAADAPPSAHQPQLVVAYVEAPAPRAAAVQARLQAYAARMRTNAAAPVVEVLSEIGRPQRMAIVERWPAGATPDEAALARDVEAEVQAPVDRRSHRPLGALMAPAAPGAFHMLMHVDVVPAGAELATKALEAQRAAVLAAPGGLGFELAVQSDRANHFAVHETWASRAAYEAYVASPPAQALRRELATVKGALFDDRFYQTAPAAARR